MEKSSPSWRQSQTECQSSEYLLQPGLLSVCLSVCLSVYLSPSSYLFPSLLYLHISYSNVNWKSRSLSPHRFLLSFTGLLAIELWVFSQWLESNQLPKMSTALRPFLFSSKTSPAHDQHSRGKWYQMRGKMTKAGLCSCSSVPLQVVMGITFYESNLIVHSYQQYAIINMSHAGWCSHSVFH